MLAALKAVEEGQSVNQVTRDHGIPKTTLKDRVSGTVAHATNPGPTPYLSTVEEDELGVVLRLDMVKQREMQWALLNPLLSTKGY